MQASDRATHTAQATGVSIADDSRPPVSQTEQQHSTERRLREGNHDSSEDEADRQLRAAGEWIRTKCRDASLTDLVGIATGIAVVIVGVIAACIYDGQLQEMRNSNELTAKALEGNRETLNETLLKMQGQIEAADRLYAEAQKQTKQTTIIAGNYGLEAEAVRNSANAAKSGAKTARDTLHISERAYITTSTPDLTFTSGVIHMSFPNTGRIPSGRAYTVLHEMTLKLSAPGLPTGTQMPIVESHWQDGSFISIPQGAPFQFGVEIPSVVPDQINAGLQSVFIAGAITYNDGFPEDSDRTWEFCWFTTYSAKSNQTLWGVCDPSIYIPLLVNNDGYPDRLRYRH